MATCSEYIRNCTLVLAIFSTIGLQPLNGQSYPSADTLQWLLDLEQAKTQARAESKHLLLFFSGSDWCKPCIKMKKEVLETLTFRNYARQHLICVLADFPRYKKNRLSKEQTAKNEALAQQYNPEGVFPQAVLAEVNGKVLTKTSYQPGGPNGFVEFLRKHLTIRKKSFKKSFTLMGAPFEITAVASTPSLADKAIATAEKEIRRIEKLISSWDPASQTSAINRHAGKEPVVVDLELFQLISRSKKVSELTNGAFDISFASIDRLWQFDGSMTTLPDSAQVAASVEKIGYQHVLLNEHDTTVWLEKPMMKIGFGGIGKGYAANRARNVMKQMGIESGIVNAGGDLFAWGLQPDGEPWKIGIADPKKKKDEQTDTDMLAWLPLENTAIVTSGDYERYALIDGKRYAHIIDPRTGWPVAGLKSVSIVCPDAELADALATAVFVMGQKIGLHLVNQLEGVECLIVNDRDEISTSENLLLDKK